MNSDYPLVSVIIPTLNEEKLISLTISPFTPELKQKYKIEVIISDGGSKDSTISIVSNFANIIVEPGPGEKQNIPIGRNAGAFKASGKYVYIMCADTRIKDIDDFFSKTLQAFENEKTVALTCKVKVFPEEEKLIDKLFHFFYNNYVFALNKLGIGMGRGECQMVRKDAFIKVGGYNEKMPAGEDFDLYRRLKKYGKIKFIRSLTVYESPRRYRKEGYPKVFWNWTVNSLSVFFWNKAISKKWEAVR